MKRMLLMIFPLSLISCGNADDPPRTVDAGDRPTKCEKDDPKNVEIRCTELDGLRTCRTYNRCR